MFSIIPVRFGVEPKGSSTSCAQLVLYKHWMVVGTGGRPLPTSLPHSSSTLLTHCLPENLISRLFSTFAKLRQCLLQEVFPRTVESCLPPTHQLYFLPPFLAMVPGKLCGFPTARAHVLFGPMLQGCL